MGLLERIPLTLLIFIPFLIGKISNQAVSGSSCSCQPGVELPVAFRASLAGTEREDFPPISHRARYIGFSRVIAQTFAVIGSLISGLFWQIPLPKELCHRFHHRHCGVMDLVDYL